MALSELRGGREAEVVHRGKGGGLSVGLRGRRLALVVVDDISQVVSAAVVGFAHAH